MAVMYSCCFWFSVRLGAIIIGVASLVQGLAFLILCCIGLQNMQAVSDTFASWLENNEMLFLKEPITDIKNDPEPLLIILTSFTSVYMFSCIVMIFGAFRCMTIVIYPFMILDLFRLIFLSVCFIIAMILVKENLYNLGLLIGFSIGGGFLLLYLFYLWFCVLSMCQIVKELEKLEYQEMYEPTPVPMEYRPKFVMDTPLGVGLNNYYNKTFDVLTKPY